MTARYLEDLRDSYKGKEIWVLGCGPSLDDYPDDFFDDKVSIALNWAFIAFPSCTYLLDYHKDVSDFIRKYIPEFTRKFIVWFPQQDSSMPYEDLIIMQRRVRECAQGDFDAAVRAIMNGEACEYVDTGTILHGGIQAAAILGATKITLAGCELTSTPEKDHAQRRSMWIHYQDYPLCFSILPTLPKPPDLRNPGCGLLWLTNAFKGYGIEVRRFYFDKGYEKIERNTYPL